MGDSHTMLAINDNNKKKINNLSSISETYYHTYWKLKKILDENKNNNIKKIYLGFSYHNLSDYSDQLIYGRDAPSVSSKYFHIMSIVDQYKLFFYNLGQFPALFKSITTISCKYLFNDNVFIEMGGDYKYINMSANQDAMENRILYQYYQGNTLNELSNINITYLKRILAFCKEKNIELVLVNTPLHKYYLKRIPGFYKEKYQELVNNMKIRVINLNLHLEDNSFTPDGDYFNYDGALIFTDEFLNSEEITE